MIRILYFARLRERLAADAERLELPPGVADIDSLRAWLSERGGVWREVFASGERVLAAVNQGMVGGEAPLSDGDEVAFFPPVTGG